MLNLNSNIKLVSEIPILNSKASESYVSVVFHYDDYKWEGYVPIEYRRTGVNIDFDDKENLYSHLNSIYLFMKPEELAEWKQQQDEFWQTKPRANTTKEFFDVLATGGWKCDACQMPHNPNPQ